MDLGLKKETILVFINTKFAYKSMTTIVGSGALCTSIKGETIFFQSDLISKSNFIILEILWKKVDFPKS